MLFGIQPNKNVFHIAVQFLLLMLQIQGLSNLGPKLINDPRLNTTTKSQMNTYNPAEYEYIRKKNVWFKKKFWS